MKLNPEQYMLDEKEHQRIFERHIKPDLFKSDMRPADHPVAVILGGQPGAGKSGILDMAFLELSQFGDVVQICGAPPSKV